MALGQAGPQFGIIGTALGAAATIYEIIDRVPEIDASSPEGIKPTSIKGKIAIENVDFNYPTRPDVQVLKGISFEALPGETVALVGSSGSGKSTIIQLLLRYYQQNSGSIRVDGHLIEHFNIKYLRSVIGVVSQEATVFNASVYDNVSCFDDSVSKEDVVNALKQANAWEFVSEFPQQLNTILGPRGSQLSGGQRARVGLAAAILHKPQILLLDEATAQLDSNSEHIVQKALDKASVGRTTIVVAHRLSTIKNANKILVMKHGEIVESGTHNELLEKKGFYHELVNTQVFADLGVEGQETEKSKRVRLTSLSSIQRRRSSILSNKEVDDIGSPTKFRKITKEKNGTNDEKDDIKRLKAELKELNVSKIMKHGEIVESGTHNELLEKKGFYHELVNTQVFADLGVEGQETEKSKRVRLTSLSSIQSRRSSILSKKEVDEIGSPTKFRKITKEKNGIDDEKDDIKRLKAELKELNVSKSLVFPVFSIVFSTILKVFSEIDKEKMRSDGHYYSMVFVVVGIFAGVTLFISSFFFGTSSEKLTSRLRGTLFRNIIGKEVAYFDDPRHSTGRLVTRLATDCPNVKNSLNYQLGQVFSGIVGLVAGVGISFYYSWQMATLCLCIFPIEGLAQALQFKYISSRNNEDNQGNEVAGKVALEAIENIKAVQALTLEDKMFTLFGNHLKYPHMTSRRKALLHAAIYSVSCSLTFFINAAAFRLALYLILNNDVAPLDTMKAIYAFAFSASGVGFAAAYLPELNKAKLASGIIFSMLKEKNTIDIFSKGGKKIEIKGKIEFKNLHFSYPQRKDVKVLKNLDITVEPMKSLALVGPSGCGKSTTIALLERFYDPEAGSVLIDGHDLRELNLHHVRSQIALVGQQPVLFDCSIRENLLYSIEDQNISDDRINEVLKMCNIYDFVQSLPDGLNTNVGAKGSQLSGGQRSRFAIGQAIIRNAKVIILDEAFAALDNESEKLVQDAVDKISKDFTVISIAHRLSSIANYDTIAVIKDGVVIEKGNHTELMSNEKGLYFELTERQNLKAN
uniref:ABC transporter domain-containing protein n=1 Tax=Rhabditophanes sp. KR3021 TaxID=114890 RepID=A0AC35TTR9_9BILA